MQTTIQRSWKWWSFYSSFFLFRYFVFVWNTKIALNVLPNRFNCNYCKLVCFFSFVASFVWCVQLTIFESNVSTLNPMYFSSVFFSRPNQQMHSCCWQLHHISFPLFLIRHFEIIRYLVGFFPSRPSFRRHNVCKLICNCCVACRRACSYVLSEIAQEERPTTEVRVGAVFAVAFFFAFKILSKS